MKTFRHAAFSHVGIVRSGNEDSGYADAHLLVIADGMGGHAAGELASAAVVASVCADVSDRPSERDGLESWVRQKLDLAHERIGDLIAEQPDRRGMGTTMTLLAALEDALLVAHIGDSRAYRLRDGILTQLSKDHTYVQALVDSGRIDPSQAMYHPRRNLLLRTIDGIHDLELDVTEHDMQLGDRYLVCSDGLNTVLTDDVIAEVLAKGDPTYVVSTLVDYVLADGAPDNVSVIVADVTEADEQQDAVLIGAARETAVREDLGAMPLPIDGPRPDAPPIASRRWRIWVIALMSIVLLLVFMFGRWAFSQYYVAEIDGRVAIFQGVRQSVGPVSLSRLERTTDVAIASLPIFDRDFVRAGISADSLMEADAIVKRLATHAEACLVEPNTPGCP